MKDSIAYLSQRQTGRTEFSCNGDTSSLTSDGGLLFCMEVMRGAIMFADSIRIEDGGIPTVKISD